MFLNWLILSEKKTMLIYQLVSSCFPSADIKQRKPGINLGIRVEPP